VPRNTSGPESASSKTDVGVMIYHWKILVRDCMQTFAPSSDEINLCYSRRVNDLVASMLGS
jgi:hypothetical protein